MPSAPQYTPTPQPKAEITADKTVGTGSFFGLIFLFPLPILSWLIWLVIALVVGALIGLTINALINFVAPYLEQAMGELGIIGNSGDLGELTELIEQFGSLDDMIGELEGRIPTE